MVASPVSVPDPNLDKYYIENVSTTSSALLHQKRREKKKNSTMGEYNWYPNDNIVDNFQTNNKIASSPTASTTRWKKNLAVHIDSHDTQVSDFNGYLQKKVATSIVAYSPSPKSRGGYDSSS